jgi:hypothetical protein
MEATGVYWKPVWHVLEPIFEADFDPCSYGFRPKRRAMDAIAEIHYLGTRSYEWVLEADIEACFDTIDHAALMGRVRRRGGDSIECSLHARIPLAFAYNQEHVTRIRR